MPESMSNWIAGAPHLIETALPVAAAALLAIIIALSVHWIAFRILRRIALVSAGPSDDVLVRRIARPSRYALVALALAFVAREFPALDALWQQIAGFAMPALIGWMALAIFHTLIHSLELRADITVADNMEARRKRTRLAIFSRIFSFLIVFITVGLMLLSIPGVRSVGMTLVASAGLAALAVGAAAQPALKALIGGLQMAMTEPIAIDDVVVIDGEWGRIEEIHTTYVVVKLWDERRLIVPTPKFLEETFQNWTAKGSPLLGTVFLYLDPLADMGPLRAEFERQITGHRLWDKRVQAMQITDTKPECIEVRLLMSASNASAAFDLRCEIRESMLAWIRENCADAIVRHRIIAEGRPKAPDTGFQTVA